MSSQDSVIVLSEDDEEATEKYLKIHYHDSKEFLDVPLESNGKVLSKDIIFMDSRIYALIIQMHGSKRMVKLKEEYVKEPKEKWKNVKVYAVLKEDCEMLWNRVRSAENHYPDVTNNWNTRIKLETPTVLTEEIQNNNQSAVTRSLPLPSNVQNKVKVEARSISRSVQHADHPIPSSTVTRKNDNLSQDESATTDDDGSDSDVEKSSYDNKPADECRSPDKEEYSLVEEGDKSGTVEPSNQDLISTYKSASLAFLKVKLCRGNKKYYETFDTVTSRFKRTMVAYPNNEFVRLIYWAHRSDIMMKQLDPSANDVCVLCDEDFTLKHLVSQKHAYMYHQKFNADPPEIAFILKPEIYKQYLDPSVLVDLKIPEFRKMEDAPGFLTTGKKFKWFSLKYILINRLVQDNLVMDLNVFSFKKIEFLRKNCNHSSLKTIFKTDNFKCDGCNKILSKNLNDYILHILSDNHLQNSLNQEELNNICKAMSLVSSKRFLWQIIRKRKQSSNNVQNGIKRQKYS